MIERETRKGDEMRHPIVWNRSTGRGLLLGALVICTGVFGGCCSIGDHTLVIQDIADQQETETGVQHTTCPDETTTIEAWPGQTITFVNATTKECNVKANAGVYTKSHVFTIGPHKCKKRKIADLEVGKEISNAINCNDDGHGTPRMIIVENPESD